MNEISFENIKYGAYQLDYKFSYLEEDTKFASAEFNRLYAQRVKLPEGSSNLIYLLSPDIDGIRNMIKSNHFKIPTSYKKMYYPRKYLGKMMNKPFRLLLKGNQIAQKNEIIKNEINLTPYATNHLIVSQSNIFFDLSDLYKSMVKLVNRIPISKLSKEFWNALIVSLTSLTPSEYEKKLLIIDADAFKFKSNARLAENKSNPLFLLYIYFLRNHNLKDMNIDMDMLICSKSRFLKFNPSQMGKDEWKIFRRALFTIMNANLDEYEKSLTDSEQKEIRDNPDISHVVSKVTEPYTTNLSPNIREVLNQSVDKSLQKRMDDKALIRDETIKAQEEISKKLGTKIPAKPEEDIFTKHLNDTIERRKGLFQSVGDDKYNSLVSEILDDEDDASFDRPDEELDEEDIEKKKIKEEELEAEDILTSDKQVAEELDDAIQDEIIPMKNLSTAPVNSKRDAKLREEQKKVVVQNSTIEEILAREASNIPVETTDKSNVMHTANDHMKKIKFANFEKTYLDKLYTKDIVSCFNSLAEKDTPFFITNIDIQDNSSPLEYTETWTVTLRDETNKRHTIKVDIPKFQDNRFMLLNGTRFTIQKQNLYNPLVKDTPDTVVLTTNYNKIIITRKATKSLSIVERIFSLVRKTKDDKMFVAGNASNGNMKYISTLEYDEIAKRVTKFHSKSCTIYFSRDYIKDNIEDIPECNNDEFFIGYEAKNPIFINEDTGLDRSGRTISQIIEQNLPDDYKEIYSSIKGSKQSMYVEGKLAGEFVPIITTLIVWNGLRKSLDMMGIEWEFMNNIKRLPPNDNKYSYIRFANGVLKYENKTFVELLMNGLKIMHPEEFQFEEFDDERGYDQFIYAKWGSYRGAQELKTFNEFLVDPITKDVCRDMNLPDTPSGLLIHAAKLLSDNTHVSKASDKSYRIRSIETIPAILYSKIAAQYKDHINSGRRIPMTLNRRCIISELMGLKTVEPYSTLNPVVEVTQTHAISTKGYRGANEEMAYKDEAKRSYDPSAIGKLAISTSPDKNVGVTRNLVVEPTISNARGYREPVENIDDLEDVNVFSPTEMLTPGTVKHDDPIRSAMNRMREVSNF